MKLSIALDNALKSTRSRRVLQDIANQDKRLMPCGDQRIAALLFRFGGIEVVNAKDHRFTTSYKVTELGLTKLKGEQNE